MTTTDLPTPPAQRRTAPALVSAGLLCVALTACSGTSSKTVAATDATQKPAASAAASTAESTAASSQERPSVAASSDAPTPADAVGSTASTATSTASAADVAAAGKPWGHPCGLVTQGELADTLGVPFGVGTEVSLPAGGFCTYGSTIDQQAQVEYSVSTWDVTVPAARDLGKTYSAVSGIGDEAFSVTDPGSAVLAVRKGTAGFYVTVGGLQIFGLPDAGLAKEKTLAAVMVKRM